MKDLTGARMTYLMLKRAGTEGVHSHEILAEKFKGHTNPSERLREIADHLEVRKRREHVNGSPGIRAWLAEFAPEGTEKVTPANGSEGGDGPLSSSVIPLRAEPLSWFRDYTDPEHEWEHIPASEALRKAMRDEQAEELRAA